MLLLLTVLAPRDGLAQLVQCPEETLPLGQVVSLNLAMENSTPSALTNAFFRVETSEQLEIQNMTATKGQWSGGGQEAQWDVATLVPRESGEATIELLAVVLGAGTATFRQGADGAQTQEQTCTIEVLAEADVFVVKTALPEEPVLVGDTLVYLIRVGNDGPGTATGIQVRDDLPASVDSP